MSFKDQIRRDLDAVFFNLDEFGELHRVEGENILVVMDEFQLSKLPSSSTAGSFKQGRLLGLIEGDVVLYGREEDLPANLEPGRLLNIDGREMLVVSSGKDLGLVEIALRQNLTG